MHIKGFLHKLLSSVMHQKRLMTLTLLIMTVLKTKKLSTTELGRGIELPIQEKSGIRRADRFLGNKKLQGERLSICKIIAERVVGDNKTPWIIVDWSEVPNCSHHILRAAFIADGRAITLYEEVHPEKKLSNPKVEKRFLKILKSILPVSSKPIIITDAGFHNKWFIEILKLKWDYVGRIRSGKKYSSNNGETWHVYTELFSQATSTAKSIGNVLLCRNNPLESYLYLYKDRMKGRSALTRAGTKRSDTNSMDHRRAAREPWVLASSLNGRGIAKRVIKIYKKRMQIEEGFRDLKSSRYGFSFENAHSKKIEKITALLLVAMLASFIAWLVGWIAEKNKLHYQFQSNTIKNRRVLSLFYLGCQVIKKNIRINNSMLAAAIEGLGTYAV